MMVRAETGSRYYELLNRRVRLVREPPISRINHLVDLIVIAKEPIPGRVKTRLCPPCGPLEAARIARSALRDTLEHALASIAERVVLALEGEAGSWCPPDVEVVDQGNGDFATRLGLAWALAKGPAFQIGMDTPQVTSDDLNAAMRELCEPGVDAVLGPASDGGWWGLGLRRVPDEPEELFRGIPMSSADTGSHQLHRLHEQGLHVRLLDDHIDVDTWSDACSVAAGAPYTYFAEAVREVRATLSRARA